MYLKKLYLQPKTLFFHHQAFSEYLGNKPFLFGEKPSIADASLFGFLAQILSTHDEDNWLRKAINDDYKVGT